MSRGWCMSEAMRKSRIRTLASARAPAKQKEKKETSASYWRWSVSRQIAHKISTHRLNKLCEPHCDKGCKCPARNTNAPDAPKARNSNGLFPGNCTFPAARGGNGCRQVAQSQRRASSQRGVWGAYDRTPGCVGGSSRAWKDIWRVWGERRCCDDSSGGNRAARA